MEETPFVHSGARALVQLHDSHLRRWHLAWKEARDIGVRLPVTKDPAYVSLDALGRHVLGAAGFYMRWCCEQLELESPGIGAAPGVDEFAARADAYLEHVLERWKTPLAGVAEERFEARDFAAPWKNLYSIDSMLEHAVMHPIRHEFQLRALK